MPLGKFPALWNFYSDSEMPIPYAMVMGAPVTKFTQAQQPGQNHRIGLPNGMSYGLSYITANPAKKSQYGSKIHNLNQ